MARALDRRELADLDRFTRETMLGGRGAVWGPFADGRVWKLVRGVDFPLGMSFDALRYSAYGWARYRGRKCSVRRLSADVVLVRFR